MECRLKDFRKEHGMTQKDVCNIVGFSLNTYRCWEQGKRTPPKWVENLILEKLSREVKK